METLITIHLQEEINEEMLIEKVEEEYQVLGVAAVSKIKREDSYCTGSTSAAPNNSTSFSTFLYVFGFGFSLAVSPGGFSSSAADSSEQAAFSDKVLFSVSQPGELLRLL